MKTTTIAAGNSGSIRIYPSEALDLTEVTVSDSVARVFATTWLTRAELNALRRTLTDILYPQSAFERPVPEPPSPVVRRLRPESGVGGAS